MQQSTKEAKKNLIKLQHIHNLYVLTEYTTHDSIQDEKKETFPFLLKRETRVSILGFNSDEEVAI